MICPKCKKEMEEGILIASGSRGGVGPVKWGTNIKVGLLGAQSENPKPIKSFRCNNCGYTEIYAK